MRCRRVLGDSYRYVYKGLVVVVVVVVVVVGSGWMDGAVVRGRERERERVCEFGLVDVRAAMRLTM